MKRFIAVLVCIFMLVSLLPAFAFAEGEPPATEGGEPTPTPTAEPTVESAPTQEPTPAPALDPTTTPTLEPTPTAEPTPTPTPVIVKSTNPAESQQLTSTGTYNVSVSVSSAGGGTVTGSGEYAENASATVTATANPGYKFVKWTENGTDVSTSVSYTFTVTGNCALVAEFTKTEVELKYTVTVNSGSGSGEYAENASVPITANEPETGKQFKEWTGADGLTFTSGSSTTSNATFTMPTNAVELTAVYEDITYAISVSPTSLDFGKVQAGYTTAPTAQTVTVKNTGNKEITLTQPASTTNYTVGTLSVDTLAPNAEATFTVTPNTGLAAKNEAYSETITVSIDQTNVSASVSAKLVVTGATPTTTSVSLSKTRVVKGETLRITAAVYGQTVHEGTIQLYIDGQPFGSPVALASGNATAWDIPATDANKLALGEHAISAKYSGSAAYAPSESSVSKVIVVSPCTPKPPCKPSHYCCGKNHFSGKCVTVRAGEDVTFKVELGCNETCQWYVNKGDGCGFVKIDGATSPRLTLKNVKYKQDGYMYRCIVQNCCDVVSKPIFTLNVASGQLYTPKTGDNGVITVAAGCAAVAALILVGGRRSSRAKQKN